MHHAAHGYARPAAYHLGDVVGGDFLPHHGVAALGGLQLALYGLDVILQLLQLGVAYLGHPLVVAFPLGSLGLVAQVFHALLVLLYAVDQLALAFPLGPEGLLLVSQLGDVLVQLGYLLGVVLPLDGLSLYLQLLQFAVYLVQLLGHGVSLHPELGGGLVHQVYGLVGQEAVADVPLGELHGGDAGIVLYPHLVVVLVTLLQSAEYGDGRQLVGLVHHDGLEASLQGLVLLEVLLVLVERGGSDGPQLAAGQGRLQYVGRVHGSLAAAGTHQGVYLVDEEDDFALRLRHLTDNALQPLLELALVLGARQEGAHVQRVELLVLQVLGHVAPHDALRQSLHDGGLAGARLADEDGVVLGAAGEYLQHAAYLLVTSYHGVQLALPGVLHQVPGVLAKGLEVLVARLRLHLLPLPQLLYGLAQLALGDARVLQYAGGGGVHAEQRQQQGLHADELVAHAGGEVLRPVEHLRGVVGEVGLAALHAWQVVELRVHERLYPLRVHAQLLEEEVRDVLALVHHAGQQVDRLYRLLPQGLALVDSGLHNLLRLDGEFVECHVFLLSVYINNVYSGGGSSNSVLKREGLPIWQILRHLLAQGEAVGARESVPLFFALWGKYPQNARKLSSICFLFH